MNFEKDLVGQFYGENNQYEIISYGIDEAFKSKQKIYLVKCHLCALDPELFGEAIFKTRMGEMKKETNLADVHQALGVILNKTL